MLIAITSKDDVLPPDLLFLRGDIEIMIHDSLLVVGPFEGALLLLPSIEALALGILHLRDRHSRVEIVLVGDSPSLWFVGKPIPKSDDVEIWYRKDKLGPILRTELDNACELAVGEFLQWLEAQRPRSTWSAEVTRIVHTVHLTWPSLV